MDSFYITDKGNEYLSSKLESDLSDTETVRDIIILQTAKEDGLNKEELELIESSSILKRSFRRLFEVGYIDKD